MPLRRLALLPLVPLFAATALTGCAPERDAWAASDAAVVDSTIRFPAAWDFQRDRVAPVLASRGMVVTTDRVASEIGAEILRRGGNAVDAAVATHFALAVVNPEAGNLGGGGFLVVRMADGTTAALDFREKAPLRATRDMYLDSLGNVSDSLSLVGHLAAGVVGSVMGMWEAHRRFGKLRWAELVQPAIALAEGIVVHERLAGSLNRNEKELRRFPATARIFLPEGRAPVVGERLVQRDLAETFRRIQQHGASGFYQGRTAELVEAEMRRGGGLITREDLAQYRAVWRDPLRFTYRGHTVISMPPPSSGGATLAEMLKILEGYDLRSLGFLSPQHVHLFAEAARRAFADRNAYLADPDFVPQPVARMASDAYARERRATIRRDRATPSAQVAPGLGPAPVAARGEGENTTHYSIVDGLGNAVAVTTTINSLYGSLVTVEGAGFLLNNEMDDFTSKPGVPNQFGLVQGAANAIAPGKRMLSAMTPTIVLDPRGRVRLVTGTPGGATIITSIAMAVSNVVDFGMDVGAATAAPRLHHQHLPDTLRYEKGGLEPATAAALRAMGHAVAERTGYQGDVQSIILLPGGYLAGVADPRRGGAAVGLGEVRRVVQ
jgi:gamma-glutamyltranspeptidase/glutathione hydrolase